MFEIEFIHPDWPAPAGIRAACTTRAGGVSVGGYASLNLAAHVADDAASVEENRRRLKTGLTLPSDPLWLTQVHGIAVAKFGDGSAPVADAVVSLRRNEVCAILTADCLPVLFSDRAGTRVGAAHAGWRGLVGGVLAQAVQALGGAPGELMAWLGPAIGPESFEVGPEVRAQFLARNTEMSECFRAADGDRWLADIYALARIELAQAGVAAVFGGGWCTVTQHERFFSFRREPRCGRMASLIWRE